MKDNLTKKYLDFIANRYKDIPCIGRNAPLTMENYIPLQLGEEEKEKRLMKREEEEPKETKDYTDFRVWREEQLFREVHSLTPVDVERAIQNKKIVIKGDPGAGKSTLLKYLAYSFATDKKKLPELIPLVIDLKDWADKGDISLSEYYAKYALKDSGLEKEDIEPLIIDWLKDGKCIILCDGLDEVPQDKRSVVIQSLQNLTSGLYRNCHILVTTRIVGYNNELSGWRHYEVMPLRKENIEQYAKDYLGDKKASAFLSALRNIPQMEPFSKNPLLLSILCFVFDRKELRLPAGRVELYKEAVSQMLELRNPKIPSSVKENVLQQIAYHFLEGKEVFSEDEVRDIIKAYLEKKKEKYDPDDVLNEIVEKNGLLSRFGSEQYIFLHLTFQEYFCACFIAKNGKEDLLKLVLFNLRFREVMRLTSGMLPKEKSCCFIEFILKQKPLCYDVLHQPLLLAGLCIADVPDDKADPSLEKEILDELLRLWKETEFDPLWQEINRVFQTLAGGRHKEKIINNLLGQLENEDWEVREYATEALGKLGCADDDVITALLKRLEDKNPWARGDASEALGNLGQADDRVINGLLKRLKDESWWVRKNVAEALGKLGRVDDRVILGLLERLEDEDWQVRGCTAHTLGYLGRTDDHIITALLERLEDEHPWVREHVAQALSNLGRTDDHVINTLLGQLKDEDSDVRVCTAAKTLDNFGQTDDRWIDRLLRQLEDKDLWVRRGAVKALGNLDHVDERVITGLLRRLEDEDSVVRSNAAWALGNLSCAENRIITALRGLLKDKYENVRNAAYSALQRLAEKQAREAFVVDVEKIPSQTRTKIGEAIEELDFKSLQEALRSYFASIPYEWYMRNELARSEAHYASICQAIFTTLEYDVRAEDPTNIGKTDMVVFTKNNKAVLIFEFKVVEQPTQGKNTALEQIKTKKYYEKYLNSGKGVYLVGIEFSKKERNIVKFDGEMVK